MADIVPTPIEWAHANRLLVAAWRLTDHRPDLADELVWRLRNYTTHIDCKTAVDELAAQAGIPGVNGKPGTPTARIRTVAASLIEQTPTRPTEPSKGLIR